jgi:hypothetical protein
MLYVATVHFQTEKWVDIQLEYLHRYISVPFRTFAVLQGIPAAPQRGKFDRIVDARGPHSGKLNLLAAEICQHASQDDVILFLDGDAFPIADPMPIIGQALSRTSLLAVRRDDNLGDRQPHPCFCAISVREWERLHGDWSPGHPWRNERGRRVTDTGGNLLRLLEINGCRWAALLRSNIRNDHPLLFGIYGGIVYHHGAGFRRPLTRYDRATTTPSELARQRAKLEKLSEQWYLRIRSDPFFFRYLLGQTKRRPAIKKAAVTNLTG